ncbi:MAG: cupredoxin domain-containing protein [Firmicutes bacterium]|nr:cupredoxin domain-containing protein [Bacillota bacterium]
MKIILKASISILITAFITVLSHCVCFAETYTVIVKEFAFSPNNLSVKSGDTVIWQNQDPYTHDVTGEGWGGPLPAGASYTYTFTTEGRYKYHCSIHPSMEGTIAVINESASTAAGGTGQMPSGGRAAGKMLLPDPQIFQKPLHVWLGLFMALLVIIQILVGTRILKMDFWFHRRLFPVIIAIILLFHGWYGFQLYFLQ